MIRLTHTLLGAILVALSLLETPLLAQVQTPGLAEANGPVELSSSAPASSVIEDARTEPEESNDSGAKICSGEEGNIAAGPEISDAKPLGLPNSIFSARPSGKPSETADKGLLDKFDPRKNELARVGYALAVILGLLVLMRLLFKRASGSLGGGGRPSGVLEVLARYPIARGQYLLVLKMARRILLVHHSGASMTTLSELTDSEEVAALLARMESGSRSREAAKFRSQLTAFEGEHERIALDGDPAKTQAVGRNGTEIVDLTRTQVRGLGALLGKRRINA